MGIGCFSHRFTQNFVIIKTRNFIEVNMLANFSYEIIETIAVLSEGSKGWKKELNLISWNGRDPKYDIRDWSENHEKMGKGITLSKEEVQTLLNTLNESNYF